MLHADDQRTASGPQRLAASLSYVSELVALLDGEGSIEYASPSYATCLGLQPEALRGTDLLELVHPDDRDQVRSTWTILQAQPAETRVVTVRQHHADSTWRTYRITLHNRLFDPLLRAIVAVSQDTTGLQAARGQAEVATARLQALQSVTDAALSHLSLDALLRHVLDRIKEVLRVDNAAILLLDEAAGELTVHVARGPEEQVEGRVRVPLGQGLAGQIAARNAPMVVEDLAAVPVVNRLLQEQLRSFMGVPLRVAGKVIGVLHAATRAPFRFSDEDVQWLEVMADRIALAIRHAQIFRAEQDARAEAVARAGETDAVVEAVADAVFVYDLNAGIVRANAAARGLLGITSQSDYAQLPLAERLARTSTSDVHGAPLPREQWPQLRVLRGQRFTGADAMEVLIHTLDGRPVRVSVSGAPIRDAKGDIAGGVLVLRDVTARWDAEETVRQQAALLALARDAIIVRAPTGVILRWNAGAEALYGWTAEEASGKVTHDLLQTRVVGADAGVRTGADVDAVVVACGTWEGTQEHTRRDGAKLTVESRQALLRDDSQRPIAILEINRDVTARDAFLAAVAHDLKTPLTSIRGHAQLARRRLSRRPTDVAALELPLLQIEQGTRHAQRLIDELSDVTRVRSGATLELERQSADLVALVRAAVAQQEGITRHRIEVTAGVPEIEAMVDVPRIERVLGNLLSNAVKYSRETSSISVEIDCVNGDRGPMAAIVVRDQGVGIPADDLPYIFDRFHRGANVVRSVPGTGVGLASVRTIVEQHGGTIRVDSAESSGTTFTVLLPLQAS